MFAECGGLQTEHQAEMVRHMEEMMGYSIQPSRFLKTFYIFTGAGDNGKTLLAKVMEQIVGRDAVAAVRADTMEDDKFRSVELHNKLIGIDDDYSKNKLLPDGFVKKASESKTITAQYKGKDAFNFQLQVVLVILANHLPPVRDLSRGMRTRAQVVKFERSFLKPNEVDRLDLLDPRRADIQRPDLWQKVFDEEMPGVLNKLIAGFYRVKARGCFDDPEPVVRARDEWMRQSNSVADFAAECLTKQADGKTFVRVKDLYVSYCSWCVVIGIADRFRVTRRSMNSSLEDLGYKLDILDGYPIIQGYKLREPHEC